tara:strand:+ start:257 stop:448 length:192 start_codon:yes stop_codon:yes gene_type:complete
MNILHLLIAIDIAFASAIWYIYNDHRAKMDALYAKYDRNYKKRWGSVLDDPALDETEIITDKN